MLGLAAIPQRVDWTPIWMKELQVVGKLLVRRGTAARKADPDGANWPWTCWPRQDGLSSLVTHRFRLEDYSQALSTVLDGAEQRVIKAVFDLLLSREELDYCMNFTFHGSASGSLIEWLVGGLRAVMERHGFTYTENGDGRGSPGRLQPDGPGKAPPVPAQSPGHLRHRTDPGSETVPEERLATAYPILVRGLCNLLIYVVDTAEGPKTFFVTLEQGYYAIPMEGDDERRTSNGCSAASNRWPRPSWSSTTNSTPTWKRSCGRQREHPPDLRSGPPAGRHGPAARALPHPGVPFRQRTSATSSGSTPWAASPTAI